MFWACLLLRLSPSPNAGTCVSLNLLCGYVSLAIMQALASAEAVFPHFPLSLASVTSPCRGQNTLCPPDKLLHIPWEPPYRSTFLQSFHLLPRSDPSLEAGTECPWGECKVGWLSNSSRPSWIKKDDALLVTLLPWGIHSNLSSEDPRLFGIQYLFEIIFGCSESSLLHESFL